MKDKPTTTTETEDSPELILDENFGDPETLYNSREWLTEALEAKGARRTGGGIGCGQADIDIILEGVEYHVTIKPISR